MKYCTKCFEIVNDTKACSCGADSLKDCTKDTSVKVTNVKGSLRAIAEPAFKEKGIPFQFYNPEKDIYTQYNAKVNAETDFSLLVPFEFYDEAFELCVTLGLAEPENKVQVDASTQSKSENSYDQRFEEATGAKHKFFRILWIVIFIVVACLLIWGIDFIAALVKNSMGIPVISKLLTFL